MCHESKLRAMSGIICDKMRLGVADILLGRTIIKTKELTFSGDRCMITSQLGALSGGRRCLLLRADMPLTTVGNIALFFVIGWPHSVFLLPAPLLSPRPRKCVVFSIFLQSGRRSLLYATLFCSAHCCC
jgi:hypothetical protein